MRGWQVKELQHPSKITVSDDVPPPQVKDGEVLVDVYAAGLNFFDLNLWFHTEIPEKPPLPFVGGAEFAGRISAKSPLPSGCRYKAGDRVYGFALGAYGEQVAVRPEYLCRMPEGLRYEAAAAVPLTLTTSYAGIVDRGLAKPKDWVLVHAAAGGVGLAAVQIAKALGCRVIGAASSPEKRRIVKEKGGADEVVDYTQEGWQKEVMRITGGKGVDVVYDPVGMVVPSLKCVGWNGRVVVVGFAAGTIEKVPANLVLLKQVSITGLAFGQTYLKDPRRAFEIQHAVAKLLSDGKLSPVTFEPIFEGLDSVSRGLGDIETRKTWGKAVVRVRNEQGDVILAKQPGERAKL